MKFQTRLSQLVSKDDNINNLQQVEICCSQKDRNHFNRRLQQRAINWDMIRLAIAYGKFQHHAHAYTWTLLDRSLIQTPYARFVDKLRGLRIIATRNSWDRRIKLITAYWAYDLRR
jgi:hypothetical protein